MAGLKELKNNSAINLKKADKGTTTVIMNKLNKIQEVEVQLENREQCKPLQAPMVNITQAKVNQIIDKLHTILQSYIKDTTDFISSIENKKIGQDTILAAMDVSS